MGNNCHVVMAHKMTSILDLSIIMQVLPRRKYMLNNRVTLVFKLTQEITLTRYTKVQTSAKARVFCVIYKIEKSM